MVITEEQERELETLVSSLKSMMDSLPKGLYIVVEGIDGGGKSTFCDNLANVLRREYALDVVQTAEFTTGKIGQYIRKHLNDNTFTNDEVQLLSMFDRLDHVTKLDGIAQMVCNELPPTTVICDRGWMSTLAYALAQNDNDINCERMQVLLEITWMISVNSKTPDLTIFLDLPVDTAIKRIEKRRSERDRYENRDTLVKVKDAYHHLINFMDLTNPSNEYTDITKHFISIDAEASEYDMVSEAMRKMRALRLPGIV